MHQIGSTITVKFDGQTVTVTQNCIVMLEMDGEDYDWMVDSPKLRKYLEIFENSGVDELYQASEEDPFTQLITDDRMLIELTGKLSFALRSDDGFKTVHVLYKNSKCACSWDRMDFFLGEFKEFLGLRDRLFGKKENFNR